MTKEDDLSISFLPDYTPEQLAEMGVYEEVYDRTKPRLASLNSWPEHWFHPDDKMGWLEWYKKYSSGRRMDDDKRQIKRWLAFKARHGGKAFQSNPTPRRAYALRNWAIDPTKLVQDPESLKIMMEEYKAKKYSKPMNKQSGIYVSNLYNKQRTDEEIIKFIKDKQSKNIEKETLDNKLKNDVMNKDLWKNASVPSFLPKLAAERPGLWANIRAKRQRGESPAKPGDKDYPDKKQWKRLTKKEALLESFLPKIAKSPAWQRSEGKNSEGGLNAKGRASYNKETGGNLKAPVTEKNPKGKRESRQNSFCSRMCGMKKKRTGSKTKSDPDSRINKALRKWRCRCA